MDLLNANPMWDSMMKHYMNRFVSSVIESCRPSGRSQSTGSFGRPQEAGTNQCNRFGRHSTRKSARHEELAMSELPTTGTVWDADDGRPPHRHRPTLLQTHPPRTRTSSRSHAGSPISSRLRRVRWLREQFPPCSPSTPSVVNGKSFPNWTDVLESFASWVTETMAGARPWWSCRGLD